MGQKVCVITGVGDATGASLVRRFAANGYQVAMIARNAVRLRTLEHEIAGAKSFVCDVGDIARLNQTLEYIVETFGFPEVVIHNAVSHTFGTFLDSDPSELEQNFRVNTTALLHLARFFAPPMIDKGHGSILVTGNTASHRGVPKYALFAPTKAAQRVLAEALARDLGPRGIHVAYITVDAAIDVTWLDPDKDGAPWLNPPPDWPHTRDEFFADSDAIAEEIFHVAHQHRSTWAFDVILRPFAEHW